MSRLLAGPEVLRGRPTAAQWVEALAIAAAASRRPGHTLEIAFTPGGAASVTEVPLPELRTA